jgi:hypothetical protein
VVGVGERSNFPDQLRRSEGNGYADLTDTSLPRLPTAGV